MPQQIHQHTFPNGLVLLAERMEHVRSATISFLVPGGAAYDPPDRRGTATLLLELLDPGAGSRDSRQLTLAFDSLGLDRGGHVGTFNLSFSAVTLGSNVSAALALYADLLLRPHLPAEELDPVKSLARQDLDGLEDEPGPRALVELYTRVYPAPLSYDHRGTYDGIATTTAEELRQHHRRLFRPNGTILSVAGHIEWGPLLDQVGQLFGDWSAREIEAFPLGPLPEPHAHLHKDLEQTQVALAYPSVPIGHDDYYQAKGAVNVLSGGMGARLFTEVREKHGLAYSVWASYRSLKDRANVVCYVGSLNDQAQQALDILLHELRKLPEGVTDEEVDRVRVGLETSLIMQQESTRARASSMASDWYFLGRIRPLDEVQSAIDRLSATSILEHVRRHPPRDFSIVTVGPRELNFGRE